MALTDQQITDIAREFAEEMCAHMEDDFIKDEAIRDNELTFRMAVNHLLQRYCLVEKSKAIKAYKAMSDYGKEKGVECAKCANYAARVWMKRLFPDIAKEVE